MNDTGQVFDFPCLDCGPTRWLLTLIGYVCEGCAGDADDSDPTHPCPMCKGRPTPKWPVGKPLIYGPASDLRCLYCKGARRVPKVNPIVERLRAVRESRGEA